MSKVKVFIQETHPDKKLAEAVSVCLKKNSDKAILFLVSGGSALKVLDLLDQKMLGKNLTISLLDERFSRDVKVNNFFQLTKTKFYHRAQKRGATFISPLVAREETLVATAENWEQRLRDWLLTNSDRVVIAVMGVGLDGHTAGIMPFPENPQKFADLFEDKEKWIVGYNAGDKNQYPLRLTVCVPFLQKIIDQTFVYAVGENKKDILKTVLKSDKIAEYPASIVNKMKQVELFTDLNLDP